jgi:hypothetical protein
MTKKEDELWVTDISMKEFPLELSNIIKEYPQLKEDISSTSIVTSDTGYLSFGNGLEETSLKSLKIKIPLTLPLTLRIISSRFFSYSAGKTCTSVIAGQSN